ncbi:FecR family protein [Flavivirga eckloniae]|uniref:Anti-sigma factor n=1 Tax=Flavivirga eckloniae TaxID=1803846 RepID=A0A2K9PU62_9FLAO|nr:FecR family protein [Flavivirga eckloniae]AUP80601.1 anti-sigma factor [Flavivirga eckloniae]
MTERIEILIVKYFSDNLSNEELKELISWVETGDNKKEFDHYVSLNFTIEELKSESHDGSILWKYIESSFKAPVKRTRYWKYAVAASVMLILGLTFFFNRSEEPKDMQKPVVVNNNIEVGTDKAILTLEDGTNIALEKGSQYASENIESNGEELVYNTSKREKTETTYNYLTVPRGGQFFVQLADETKVWLNSESKIKYPTSFIKGELRQVELVYGEAYFDVSSSTNHNGSEFRVKHLSQDIQVLGTEFNVKAYGDDKNIFTTLVEGKVNISTRNGKKMLEPGEQSIVNYNDETITVSKADLYRETSWKQGVFSFEDKPLKDIMKVLSRWYDMEVVFLNPKIEDVLFYGKIRKDQKIEDILESIKDLSMIENYEINDKTISLK